MSDPRLRNLNDVQCWSRSSSAWCKRTRAEGLTGRPAQGAALGERPEIRFEGPTARPVVSSASSQPNDLPGLQPFRATCGPQFPGLQPWLDDWSDLRPYCARRHCHQFPGLQPGLDDWPDLRPCCAPNQRPRWSRPCWLRRRRRWPRSSSASYKRTRAEGLTGRPAQGAALGERPERRFEGPTARPVVSSAQPNDLPGLQPFRATYGPRFPGLQPGLDDWSDLRPCCAPKPRPRWSRPCWLRRRRRWPRSSSASYKRTRAEGLTGRPAQGASPG